MKKVILKYGCIGGLVLTVLGLLNWYLIAPYFSVFISQTLGYLGITLAMLCVPLGIKYYRDQQNEGMVSLGDGLKIGFAITAIASIIIFFYGMIFHTFYGDEFLEWQKKGLSTEELEKLQNQLAAMPEMASEPWFQGLIICVIILLFGTVMTLISSFVLKKSS